MKVVADKSILDVMRSRKSIRHFDPEKKIPKETLEEILETASRAPSSWNLQHWRFIVVETAETKERLLPIAWNQKQVRECSSLILVLGDKEAFKNGEEIFSQQTALGYMTEEVKNAYLKILPSVYQNQQFAEQEAIRNASLAAMQIMLAAKAFGIDSNPIIGFKEAELRQALRIPERYIPVLLIALGYGSKPAHETIRLPLTKTVYYETC